ncbi:CLUMA_CG014564, isoform A [Clunio marinus]|uniref:CLUMA_CG014564, isoform A n=1 Tax=Clunio marinus TaxID=568069 RepID=A0A1J1IMH7_9DIPT|nr:CLUMA_CG014564, isoform A [Clunio marinus]
MKEFLYLIQLLTGKQNATKQLSENNELQGIRFALKLAVNGPLNHLNEHSKTTLIEAYQKLSDFLSGQRVTTSKGAIAITDHPEAADWTKLRLAEKLIVSFFLLFMIK